MQARDLRCGPPRRWTESIDGILWLPRMVDKVRAGLAGTLGAYLYGQSPFDTSLLRTLGLSHTAFARIVRNAVDDESVLRALEIQDPQSLGRARSWSRKLERRHRLFMFVLDVDDGYAGDIWKPIKPAVNLAANGVTWTMKRLWPSSAIEKSKG